MLCFSIFYTAVILFIFGLLSRLENHSVLGGIPQLWRIFLWPALLLAEAIVYWIIRRRNTYARASWAHCLLVLLGFILLFFRDILAILHSPVASTLVYSTVPFILFWSCMLTAHGIFVWVIVKSFSQNDLQP